MEIRPDIPEFSLRRDRKSGEWKRMEPPRRNRE